MQTIENRTQFMQEAQQALQRIEAQLQQLSPSQQSTRTVDDATSQEINRLTNQRRNLQEALERYGNDSDDNWQSVRNEAQQILQEADHSNNPSTPAFGYGNTPENDSKYTVSTAQSDRGADGSIPGLGDRAGMEHPQSGLDNTTQYSSFGNPYNEEREQEIEERRPQRRAEDADNQRTRSNPGQGQGESQRESHHEGRTRRQGDDYTGEQGGSNAMTSYDQIQAADHKRQNEEEDAGLTRTNVGGDATQDDPESSVGREDTDQDYNGTKRRQQDRREARERHWDSRAE